jgi:hypothetical protein
MGVQNIIETRERVSGGGPGERIAWPTGGKNGRKNNRRALRFTVLRPKC